MSIQSQAMIAGFSTTSIGKKREDKRLTDETIQRNDMESGAVEVNKRLFPKSAYIPTDLFVGECRRFHDRLTFDTPLGAILTLTGYEEWKAGMNQRQRDYQELVQSHWIDRWEHHMQSARDLLNGSFEPAWYPTCAADALKKFSFITFESPLPRAEHVVLQHLCAETQDALRTQFEANLMSVEAKVKADAANRVLDAVRHIAAKLADDKPRIFDSMLEHLENNLKLASAFSDDPHMQGLVRAARANLNTTTERLRNSPAARSETMMQAKVIAARFGGIGQRRLAA